MINLEIKIPNDSHELLSLLANEKVLTKEFARRNLKMPGFRNRLVHQYDDVDHVKTYKYLQEHFSDLQEFINQVSRFLLKQE